jgi:hypothetical protein
LWGECQNSSIHLHVRDIINIMIIEKSSYYVLANAKPICHSLTFAITTFWGSFLPGLESFSQPFFPLLLFPMPFSSMQWGWQSKDVFQLGSLITAAFRFFFFSTTCAVLRLSSQLYWSSIDLLQEVWGLWVKLWPTIQWHRVFPEFLTWVIAYFQCTYSSPTKSDCPCRENIKLAKGLFLNANGYKTTTPVITTSSFPEPHNLPFPPPHNSPFCSPFSPHRNLQPLVGATSPPYIGYAPIT